MKENPWTKKKKMSKNQNEMGDKYLELSREQKKSMELESDDDTNCN